MQIGTSLRANSENAMSTQKDIIGARKQQTSGPSRRALIASGVATAARTPVIRDAEPNGRNRHL
jgi:hypothetical protein